MAPKLTKLQKDALALMPEIVKANGSQLGYMFTDPFTTNYLEEIGYVEMNREITNGEEVATRATAAGIQFVTGNANTEVKGEEPMSEKAPAVVTGFVIEDSIEIPKTSRANNSKYPFDKLEVGQSFFIPGKTAKSLASTVSSATQRYAKEAEGTRTNRKGEEVPNVVFERKFIVRDADGGARVWRKE